MCLQGTGRFAWSECSRLVAVVAGDLGGFLMARASDSRQEQLTGSSGIRMERQITQSPRVFAVLMVVVLRNEHRLMTALRRISGHRCGQRAMSSCAESLGHGRLTDGAARSEASTRRSVARRALSEPLSRKASSGVHAHWTPRTNLPVRATTARGSRTRFHARSATLPERSLAGRTDWSFVGCVTGGCQSSGSK